MAGSLVVHPEFQAITSELQEAIYAFDSNSDVITEGGRNTIKTVVIGGKKLNIKKFKTPGFLQSLVYRFVRKSKAARSFSYAIKLMECGIKTPMPVAYSNQHSLGLKESYYVSEHLDYDFDFRVLNHNPTFPDRKKILEQAAAFTYKLHENNIEFLDHSPGNTLIKKRDDGNYDFYLIDLNRMRFRSLDFNRRMNNFRRLWLSKTMINTMAPIYAGLYGKSNEEAHALMTYYSRKFQKKVNSKKLRRRKRQS